MQLEIAERLQTIAPYTLVLTKRDALFAQDAARRSG